MSTVAALLQRTCPRCGAIYDRDAAFCAKDGTRLDSDDQEEAAPDSDPYLGTVISGDIEILSVAGVGAMGRVYRAHQRGIERDVAVKILHRELSGNTQLVAHFHREAKIASKLQHPHVVEVYLAGQLPDRALYIAMEYLDGMSLAAAIAAAGGVFNPARALSIALQICDAVGEGHARGIVHRDLKPENVMLVRRADMSDWVKVLDFGIAKVNLGEQSMQTAAGLVFGTARYISPEGAQGATVGPPGDVYSLATMVYQMLAGRTPFDAEPLGLLIKHIHEAPPPLTSWPRAAGIHPALAKVVMDNLAKDPAQRAPGARVFGSQLAAAAREANITISEMGIVARLSNVDFLRAHAIDPTLDDASAQPGAPGAASASAVKAVVAATPGPNVTARLVVAPTPVPPALEGEPDRELDVEPASPSAKGPAAHRGRSPLAWVVLAFMLGVAVAVLVVQYNARRGAEAREAREAHIAKTRAALAESRYVAPPGDCVRDLVVDGLKRWPHDIDLVELRATASTELVTHAMVIENGGDVVGAHDLARAATQLDPTDQSAALLVGQYAEELRKLDSDAGSSAGRPRVLFGALPPTHAGREVGLTARVTPGGGNARASSINDARITLFDHGAVTGGTRIPLTSAGQGVYRATLRPTKAGTYDVVFEASIEGPNLRAVRELTVVE